MEPQHTPPKKIYGQLVLVGIGLAAIAVLALFKSPAPAFKEGGSHAVKSDAVSLQPIRLLPSDLGKNMLEAGVIDRDAFMSLYAGDPELERQAHELLSGDEALVVTQENATIVLNYFWALGLGNKNEILEMEMMNPAYGGAGRFASTGGWTLANGDAMDHYNKHRFIALAPEQQALVDRVSRLVYRPCCRNSAHFPDCNHGMAMLGFLEYEASNGANEQELIADAQTLNYYWFPGAYAASCGV